MVELLRRNPVAEDVQEILCRPRLQYLPPEATSQLRLLEQAKANLAKKLEFVKMIESIISTKEDDEREDHADDRRRALGPGACVLTGAHTKKHLKR